MLANHLTLGAAAYIQAQTALMNCRVAGMIAANQRYKIIGESPAYDELHFAAIEREFEPVLGHNAIMEMARG